MNVRDLHEHLRTNFTCVNGTPRAYMEIPCPLPDQQIHVARFVYEIIGVTMRGEPEAIEEILCGWVWQKMLAGFEKEEIEDRGVLILFRRWPEVSNYIDEQGHECVKLTMRLAIPARDLETIFGEALLKEGERLYQL